MYTKTLADRNGTVRNGTVRNRTAKDRSTKNWSTKNWSTRDRSTKFRTANDQTAKDRRPSPTDGFFIHILRITTFTATISLAGSASAALLLTEIHYNGPASGTDPDEFLELSNAGDLPLQLDGYRFGAGVGFSFPDATELAPGASLVVARSRDDFSSVYTDFSAPLFDFSGALSNGGETLTLLDALGTELWSLDYDDSSPWPGSADGGGDSLQLSLDASSLTDPASWLAAEPTPGQWRITGSDQPTASVPAPPPLALLLAGLGLIGLRAARDSRGSFQTGGE